MSNTKFPQFSHSKFTYSYKNTALRSGRLYCLRIGSVYPSTPLAAMAATAARMRSTGMVSAKRT